MVGKARIGDYCHQLDGMWTGMIFLLLLSEFDFQPPGALAPSSVCFYECSVKCDGEEEAEGPPLPPSSLLLMPVRPSCMAAPYDSDPLVALYPVSGTHSARCLDSDMSTHLQIKLKNHICVG